MNNSVQDFLYKPSDSGKNIELLLSFTPKAQKRFGIEKVKQFLKISHGQYAVSPDGSSMQAFGVSLETDASDVVVEGEHGKNAYYMLNEQPLTWTLLAPFILEGLVTAKVGGEDPIGFLAIGTGSGVYAAFAAKMFEFFNYKEKIIGLDVNPRALEFAKRNLERNGLAENVQLIAEWFEKTTFSNNSVKTAGIWPPYHPCDAQYRSLIPRHAWGGEDMQEVWRSQIQTCYPALADNGVLVFNQQSPGGDTWRGPQAIAELPDLAPDASVIFTDLFGPYNISNFLDAIYPGDDQLEYRRRTKEKYTTIHYLAGAIIKDGLGRRIEFDHRLDNLPGWENDPGSRIGCHRGIADLIRSAAATLR